jgi:hypothetical protein
MMESRFRGSEFGRNLRGLDLDEVVGAGRKLLEEEPRTRSELAPLLAPHWPDRDPHALAYAVMFLAPLVQVPPRGIWVRRERHAWPRRRLAR